MAVDEETEPVDRTIVRVLDTEWAEGGLVKRAIPSVKIGYEQVDPFLLLDIFDTSNIRSTALSGFSEHPHRGFEIITYRLSGQAFKQVIREDDGRKTVVSGTLQRVTTGRGIRHGEGGDLGKSHEPLKGLQLWVNLPRKDKNVPFDYQTLETEEIPVTEQNGSKIQMLVGGKSPIRVHTPSLYLDVAVSPGNVFNWDIPVDYQGFAYVLNGRGNFGANKVEGKEGKFLLLGRGEKFTVTASSEPLRFILTAGKPHREPIHWSGPFVD